VQKLNCQEWKGSYKNTSFFFVDAALQDSGAAAWLLTVGRVRTSPRQRSNGDLWTVVVCGVWTVFRTVWKLLQRHNVVYSCIWKVRYYKYLLTDEMNSCLNMRVFNIGNLVTRNVREHVWFNLWQFVNSGMNMECTIVQGLIAWELLGQKFMGTNYSTYTTVKD